jgi:hypothetical protein
MSEQLDKSDPPIGIETVCVDGDRKIVAAIECQFAMRLQSQDELYAPPTGNTPHSYLRTHRVRLHKSYKAEAKSLLA